VSNAIMAYIVRLLPGLIGAAVAFLIVQVLAAVAGLTNWEQALVFAIVYLLVTILADRAMTAYGRRGG
jgi:hypothetical protein